MTAAEDILERADAWQRAIEARDPEAAAEFLAGDYALVVTHPEVAVVPRKSWLRMLPDYADRRRGEPAGLAPPLDAAVRRPASAAVRATRRRRRFARA